MPSGFLSGNTKKTSRSESTKLKFLSKKSIYSPPGMCFVSWVRLGTFISLVTLGRGKLKAAFCPSVSLGKLSSGQVVPASPRPTDSEPCGCPDSLPKRCFGNFLVRSGSFWVFHERCLGRTLSMALTFVTNQFVLLAISGNGVQRFSVRSFQHVLSGGAAQHATKRPAMVWRRILRSGTSLNTITPFQWYFLLNLLFQDVLDSFTWLFFWFGSCLGVASMNASNVNRATFAMGAIPLRGRDMESSFLHFDFWHVYMWYLVHHATVVGVLTIHSLRGKDPEPDTQLYTAIQNLLRDF